MVALWLLAKWSINRFFCAVMKFLCNVRDSHSKSLESGYQQKKVSVVFVVSSRGFTQSWILKLMCRAPSSGQIP